jgi:hypothetical protein
MDVDPVRWAASDRGRTAEAVHPSLLIVVVRSGFEPLGGRDSSRLAASNDRPNRIGANMGILGSVTKIGFAKKAFDEARKPKNQRRLKQVWAKVTNKRSSNRR